MWSMLEQQSGVVWVVVAAAIALLVWLSGAIRYIPNTRVAVVEKLWSAHGSLRGGFIALRGEAGFQQQVVRGGWHLFFPFQYRVHRVPLVTIPQGKIGYVFARDGIPLPATQALASNGEANDFTNVGGFLA
ncbi:MAG TPA: flotillin family protein, partial [Polyangia bacterium]|nr:flotillin family protein [Polyangia bacterium]